MAVILQFQSTGKPDRPQLEPGHTATILMYTGVTIERIDFEAQRTVARLAESELARVAN
jgi:hypothetical protein